MRVQAGVVTEPQQSTRTQIDALVIVEPSRHRRASSRAVRQPARRPPDQAARRPDRASWPRSRARRASTRRARSRPRLRRKRRCRTSSTTAPAISPAPRRCSTDARPSPQSARHRARRRLRPGRRRHRRRHAALPRGSIAPARASTASPAAASDPLTDELQRCQALAAQAKDDAACEAAWAESRRRFFTYQPTPERRRPRRPHQPNLSDR